MATAVYPPGPRNLPVVGHLPAFRRDPIRFLERMAREFGDVAYFRLGPQPVYLLNDPELIKEVLVNQQQNFKKSRVLQKAKTLLGEGLLTSQGAAHIRQRKLVSPAFHRQRLMGYAEAMVELGERTRSRWKAGETRDIAEDMMRLTLGVVGKTLFSADVEEEAGEIGEAMDVVLGLFQIALLPFSELIEHLPLPVSVRFRKARERLDRTIYKIINERRASGEDRGDLLSMLILAQDDEGGAGMTDKQVRDEAMTLFLAGHETTANALTWTWYLLSQNPEAERKFHEEIDGVLEGRLPGFEDLPRLRYTESVLAESIRLYPPAWTLGRMAIEDCRIGTYEVAAESIVLMSPWVTQRDGRFWPEAGRFLPERFLEDAPERPKFAYFPFGGGSRVCIGERFAWMEGVLLLATIGQWWRFGLWEGQRVEPRPMITLRPRYGMKMILEQRGTH